MREIIHLRMALESFTTAASEICCETQFSNSEDPHRGLYKILFHFKALWWESIVLLLPPLHLQSLPYCSTIARPLRNIRPPTDPLFVCHTPYNIGPGNIV